MVDETTVGNKVDPYTVANPHPGYGKDPNIANEFGHTHYPKYVQTKDGAKVANDEDEEASLLEQFGEPDKPEKVEKSVAKKKPVGWDK